MSPETAGTDSTPRLRAVRDLPGPRQLPLIGNLHQIDTARMHLAIEAWSERYGPLFRFRIGRRTIVGVAEPAAIGAILRDRPEGFRRTTLLEAVFRELGIAGVFAANGAAWRAQRKMVVAAFDTRHLKSYYPFLARVTERLYRRWCVSAERGIAFDLQADLMRYTVDVAAGLAFGTDLNTIESEGETIQTHLNHVFPMLNRRLAAPVAYWRWLRLPVDRTLDAHLAKVHQAVGALIGDARERLARSPELRTAPSNLLEAMLMESQAPDSGLTESDVASNVITLLLAGEDTTANTLAWLIYLASGDAGVMNRLADEARGVFGESHCAERLEQASALEFAAACAQEAMRLKPVAPIIILESIGPAVVGDVAIPAGTVVAAVMRGGATNPRYFERPTSFEPDRWLVRDGAAAGSAGRERISMPFGAGPRICPGRNLALLEISLVTSMLFRHFTIAVAAADGKSVKEGLAFTMSPSKLSISLARRG